jgi:hypothetical protein
VRWQLALEKMVFERKGTHVIRTVTMKEDVEERDGFSSSSLLEDQRWSWVREKIHSSRCVFFLPSKMTIYLGAG